MEAVARVALGRPAKAKFAPPSGLAGFQIRRGNFREGLY